MYHCVCLPVCHSFGHGDSAASSPSVVSHYGLPRALAPRVVGRGGRWYQKSSDGCDTDSGSGDSVLVLCTVRLSPLYHCVCRRRDPTGGGAQPSLLRPLFPPVKNTPPFPRF